MYSKREKIYFQVNSIIQFEKETRVSQIHRFSILTFKPQDIKRFQTNFHVYTKRRTFRQERKGRRRLGLRFRPLLTRKFIFREPTVRLPTGFELIRRSTPEDSRKGFHGLSFFVELVYPGKRSYT